MEINLVPGIKKQLLKTQHLRRLVIFIIAATFIVLGVVIIVLFSVLGWQKSADSRLDTDIEVAYNQFANTPNTDASLTIQNQLNNLNKVFAEKMETSRIFSILDVVLPNTSEKVMLSNLKIDFDKNLINVEGQATSASSNDYKALEAFEQTVVRTYFDYGRYVDKDGNYIPTKDITEVLEDGSIYGVYEKKTCTLETNGDGSQIENCNTIDTIKIKRYMTADELKDAEYYFESVCDGKENVSGDGKINITSSCQLVPKGVDIIDRTAGRNSATNQVVLRFNGRMTIDPNVFLFANKHMMILSPARQIVTDSYTQIRDMFEEPAKDCAEGDAECQTEEENYGQ